MPRNIFHQYPSQKKISPLLKGQRARETLLPACLYSASPVTVKLFAGLFIFRMTGNAERYPREQADRRSSIG